MREGAKDTAIAFTSKLAVLGISVAVQSSLAWLLGPDGRGSYAVCLLFATLLATLFTFSVDRAGQYFAASRRMDLSEGVVATLLVLLIGSGIAMVVGRVLMGSDLSFFQKAERSSFHIALAIIPATALFNATIMLLVGLRRFVAMAIVSLLNVATQLVVALALIFGLKLGVNGALLAVLAALTVGTLVGARFFARNDGVVLCHVGWRHVRLLLLYGIRYYVARLSNLVHFRIGTIILALFAAPAEIGLFAAASTLVSKVLLIPDSIEMALYSRVADDEEGRPRIVARSARVSALISAAVLVLLILLSRPLVRIVLSPRFEDVVVLIWILAPGIFLRSIAKVLMAYFMGTDRPATCSWAIGIGTVVNLAALLTLLPVMGLRGAAWAMSLGYTASSFVLFGAFARATGTPLRGIVVPTRGDVTVAADLAGMLVKRAARFVGWRGGSSTD